MVSALKLGVTAATLIAAKVVRQGRTLTGPSQVGRTLGERPLSTM